MYVQEEPPQRNHSILMEIDEIEELTLIEDELHHLLKRKKKSLSQRLQRELVKADIKVPSAHQFDEHENVSQLRSVSTPRPSRTESPPTPKALKQDYLLLAFDGHTVPDTETATQETQSGDDHWSSVSSDPDHNCGKLGITTISQAEAPSNCPRPSSPVDHIQLSAKTDYRSSCSL